MLRKRGKAGTLASLTAMIVAALVGFYVDAHTPSVAEAKESTRAGVSAVDLDCGESAAVEDPAAHAVL